MFQPETVERDEYGWWLHSALRDGEDEDVRKIPVAEDMDFHFVEFYEDAPTELQAAYESGGSLHGDEEEMKRAVREWQPTAPKGEGWFLLGIWDTEDGPYACFTRPKGQSL